ncbi:polymorphic toxin-type HINT domain-containing protein [Tuwongella immobilis]|uniref:polymorphic toxin-type HINT domain-containing protein n=1 Tax=Tuwongella immobilis TaxID=692036 RepID=UPI0036F2DF94
MRTNGEHPFWSDRSERGLGWAKASELVAGDRLLAASGEWLTIDAAEETADDEVVYNCRVAEWHTYFVGDDAWGWAAWAHHAYIVLPSGTRIGTHNELNNAGIIDSHHIIQNAAVRDLPNYNRGQAPAIELAGPSTLIGSPHYLATREQDLPGGGTYAAERIVAERALAAAGINAAEIAVALQRADEYFIITLGITMDTVTRIPGNRR